MGLHDKSLIPFVIDFGIAKQLRHSETHIHAPIRRGRGSVVGTPAFASINNHLGVELSQRDDLESLVYILMYLSCGSLPWLQRTQPGKHKRPLKRPNTSAILASKQRQLEHSCGIPELSTILLYVRTLSFSETPDYDYIRSLLRVGDIGQLSADEAQLIKYDLSWPSDPSLSDFNDSLPSASKHAPSDHAQYMSPAPRRLGPRRVLHSSGRTINCNESDPSPIKHPWIAA